MVSGEGFLWFIFFAGMAIIGCKKVFGVFDNDGAVKKTVKNGVINKLGKWLS